MSLAGLARPVLAFRHRYSLETDYDYGLVELSTDGGTTWSPPLAAYSGEVPAFGNEQLDLTAFAGATSLKVRFRLLTDDSVVRDGWHLDDVRIGSAPAPVTLAPASAVGRNHLTLSWSAATGSFSGYEIYRSATPGLDWRSAWRVGSVSAQATTTFTDITVSPKSNYHYRLVVVDADGLRTASNETSVTTLAGMDYPFLDDGEGGGRVWTADAPWALSDEAALSGSFAWSDSPQSNYAPDIASQALTLSAPVNLSSAVDPVLAFRHRHAFAAGDYGYVEVSTNGGTDWATLATFSGNSAAGQWQRARVSLAAHRAAGVLVRFRLTSDAGATADGWYLDDISLSEAPATVPAPVVVATGSTSVGLSWQASVDPMFSHFLVVRAREAGVGLNSILVAQIAGAGNTTFSDTGLLLDTTYYYRVYAVNTYGGLSADSATEAQLRTLNNPLPFAENFEGGLSAWLLNGTWALTSEAAHGGTQSLTDSPNASYAPGTDTYAETAVDLRGTTWPVLTFWDRFAMGGGDWARVEVYDGNETWVWGSPYGVSDGATRPEWRRQQIDLSQFKGRGNVRIRFRVGTDGGTPGDGWFIDDIAIGENPLAGVAQVLPFTEDFESGLEAWLPSSWAVALDAAAKDGAQSALSCPSRMGPDTHHPLELARPLALPAGSNVQVTFSVRGYLDPGSWFRVQYSADGGVSWPELPTCNLDHPFGSYGVNTGWTRLQASLAGLAGQTIRLRLLTGSDRHARHEDIWVDSFGLGEQAPLAPTPLSPIANAWVPVVRPTLQVQNAVDLQSDALTYRFEVYSDVELINLVSQMPAVAAGATATTWQVDVNLLNNTQYWWRSRANDGSNDGAWSTVATFYVNEVNHPPSIPEQLGPADGAILFGGDDWLFWRESTDSDAGDRVIAYNIQTSKTADFAAVVVNEESIVAPLGEPGAPSALAVSLSALARADALEPGAAYYWRIRARDNRLGWSA